MASNPLYYTSKKLSMTGSPFDGCSVMKSTGACTYSGATSNANRRRMSANVALASSIVKSCPMHDRWPKEKDSSAFGCAAALPSRPGTGAG